MRDSSFSAVLFVVLIHLSTWGTTSAQDVPQDNIDLAIIPDGETDSQQPARFEVEIVVFAYNAFNAAEEEFDRELHVPNTIDQSAQDGPDVNPSTQASGSSSTPSERAESLPLPGNRSRQDPFHFEILEPADLTLTAACDKLERLDAYTVLVHGGWVQEGLPEEHAQQLDMSLFGEPRVSGTLQMHVSRYVHLTAALDYYRPDAYQENTRLPRKFELRQTRRMRSGELHYLDHPAFGLLVMVRPHDDPEAVVSESDGASTPTTAPAI